MYDKVLFYLESCYYDFHCKNKEEVQRIINEIIEENPDETSYVKLGMLAKRRCIGEL